MAVDKKRKKKPDEKPINEVLIDVLLADYKKPEDVIGENGLLKRLTKAVLQRAMNAELADHLGYRKHDPAGYNSGNSRNGGTSKTLQGNFGEIELETPRDRNGTFEPKIVAKGQTTRAGNLWRGSLAHTDFQCDRSDRGRSAGLAKSLAG